MKPVHWRFLFVIFLSCLPQTCNNIISYQQQKKQKYLLFHSLQAILHFTSTTYIERNRSTLNHFNSSAQCSTPKNEQLTHGPTPGIQPHQHKSTLQTFCCESVTKPGNQLKSSPLQQ